MLSISHSIYRCRDFAADVTSLFHDQAAAVARGAADTRFWLHATGKLRRFLLVHFRKRYVRDQLLARQGQCRQCGTCCNLLFTCPMLTREGQCLSYGLCRPGACKVFPIDQRDVDEARAAGGRCGYYFDDGPAMEQGPAPAVDSPRPRG